VFTAEMTEHCFELVLYCDMSAGLHIDARHSDAIPNWRVHRPSILDEDWPPSCQPSSDTGVGRLRHQLDSRG
jgi:hypothetical protein